MYHEQDGILNLLLRTTSRRHLFQEAAVHKCSAMDVWLYLNYTSIILGYSLVIHERRKYIVVKLVAYSAQLY